MRKVDRFREMEEYWGRVGGAIPQIIGDSSKVKSRDDLLAWLYTDEFWHNYKLQECWYIVDMLMMDEWTKLDVKIFHTIGLHVVVDNLSYFDKEEVLQIVGCGDTQFRSSISKLEEANMLQMLNNRLEKKTQRICRITPMAYWKGNLGIRNMYVENWYKVKLSKEELDRILLPQRFSNV